jgi:hypothetical protein
MILQVIVESGVKHHQTNKQTENVLIYKIIARHDNVIAL